MELDEICHIHIPKCAGTYIGTLIFGKITPHEPFDYEINKISKYGCLKNKNYKLIFTVIRNPITFYISLFKFFKNANKDKKISNKMKFLADQYNNINDFIERILNGPDFNEKNSGYDKDYNPEKLNYGLFTHYLKWFCGSFVSNLNDKSEIFVKQIKDSKILFLKLEELNTDIKILEKYGITINNNNKIIHNISNKNISNVNYELNEKTINLIKNKDKYIFENFYNN